MSARARLCALFVVVSVACSAATPAPTGTPSPAPVATATPTPTPTPRTIVSRSVSRVGAMIAASGAFRGGSATQVALIAEPASDLALRVTVREVGASADPAGTVWFQSDPNFFALARAKFTVADVTHDGMDDLIALYDSGAGTARLYVFPSTGTGFRFGGIWWSGEYTWSRARNILAGRFANGARDTILVTYQDDGARMRIHAFESSGSALSLARVAYDSGPGQFDLARTRVAVGKFTRAGVTDQLAFLAQVKTRASVTILESDGATFTRRDAYESDADYEVARSTIAATDTNGDGTDELVSLLVDDEGGARVQLFDAVAGFKPAAWAGQAVIAAGGLCAGPSGLVVGDWDRDGRGDALALAPAAGAGVRSHVLASRASGVSVTSAGDPLRCPVWPLTGVPLGFGDATKRPVYVKIDNNPTARPHYGLSQADQVYEWLVEGLTTRLAAVYQSQRPTVIGSVRSVRMTDRPVLPALGAALVYSGGGPEELMAVNYDAAVAKRYIDLAPSYGWGYRVEFRPAPYNYFTSFDAVQRAIAAAPDGTQPAIVTPWSFLTSATGDPLAGGFTTSVAATSVTIPYRALFGVSYRYDPATRTYARFNNGVREVDAANAQAIAARNIVVIQTEVHFTTAFGLDPAGNPKLDEVMTGSGKGVVFRDGRRQEVSWTRPDITDVFTLRDPGGALVELSPGQTWIHVVPNDWVIASD